MDWKLFNAIVEQLIAAGEINGVRAGERAKKIMDANPYHWKEDGTIVLLPAPAPTPAPTPEPAPAPDLKPRKHLTLEEARLRNRAVKALVDTGEKRLAKASLDASPIGETFLSILLDAMDPLFDELMLAFSASTGIEFLEDLENLEDPETGLVPLMKRHGVIPGRWTMEFHKEVAVKQPPAPSPKPVPAPVEDTGPSVTVTEGDNGLPTISVELVQPSTNFIVNPDGTIGEQIVATEPVTVDNAFSMMQRVNARRNQRRNHQRNAG